MKTTQFIPVVGLLALGACTTTPSIPARAVLLAQVSYVAQGDEAVKGFQHVAQPDEALNGVVPQPKHQPPAKRSIESCSGAHDADAKFALVRFYYFQVGRSGMLFDFSEWTLVEAGVPVERGNLVEVELRPNSRCMVTRKIRATNLAAAGCEFHRDEQSALFSVLDMASGQASASLYCPFFKTEQWTSTAIGVVGGLAWWEPPPTEAR